MRAWAVVENEAPLQEIELPTPEPRGTEVLLETTYCGVCHSDIHIWEGRYDLGGGQVLRMKDRGMTLPLAMGHEIVGRVVRLGPDAIGVKPGDIRIVFPWVGCGTCAACRSQDDNMCATPRYLGVYRNGGYATHVLAPHPRHLVDPGTLDPALAATYACGGPALAIIDLVNATATARAAFAALGKGGKLVQVGLFGGELSLPLPLMPIRALTIQGSYVGNPKELRELVGLAQSGRLPAIPITTMPQNQANEALMRLRDGHVVGRLVLKAEAA